MGMKIYIPIEDRKVIIDFLKEGERKGLVRSWSIDKIDELLSRKEFPILLPIDLDEIMDLVESNKIVKKIFESKFDKAVGVCLQRILSAG